MLDMSAEQAQAVGNVLAHADEAVSIDKVDNLAWADYRVTSVRVGDGLTLIDEHGNITVLAPTEPMGRVA